MKKDNTKAFRAQAYLFRRYMWLLALLYDYQKLSFKEISSQWEHSSLNSDGSELPNRTFHDHIDAIEEIFNISIRNERRGGYRYYIENIDDLNSNKLTSWILQNFSLGNALSDARSIEDRVIFHDIPSSRRWLSTILSAIKSRNILLVDYTSRTLGKIPTLKIRPLFVKLYEDRWYVYAHCEGSDVMKHYALDCIDDMSVTEQKFDDEPDETERYSLENSFGHSIYPDIKPQHILIKATLQAAKHLDTLPLHHSQKKIRQEEDYVIYRYFFAPTPEFSYLMKKWEGQLEIIPEEK